MDPSSYVCLVFMLTIACHLISFSHSFSSSSLKPHCIDDERRALLLLKDSLFNTNNSCSVYSKVESWKKEESSSSNCCLWDGVECDPKTNHVISLDLSYSCLFGSINSSSSLFSLVHLKSLNLAYNDFHSSKIPSEIGKLSSLIYLNLSYSDFSGQIPFQISNLSKLASFDLSSNDLELHKPDLKGLVQNLSNLKELHLSNVNISSSVPDLLANFSSLESLRLDNSGLNGEFPLSIFHLPNLKMVDLSNNEDLRGYLPKFNLGSLLQSLILYDTNFGGEIPPLIGNLTDLQVLDIWSCSFTGMLPSSLGNLHNLAYIDLSSNSFSALTSSSLSWVGKLSKLSSLGLYLVNLNGGFPSSLINLTQLSDLDLAYNQLTGPIPSWLMNFTKLADLYLDHNHLIGQIPSSLIYQPKIRNLLLGSNQLSGQIPSHTCNHSQLTNLDLSFNQLQGSIPSTLSCLKNLQTLNLFSNNLVGEVDLDLFFQLKNLTTLMLSYNNLSLSKINATIFPNFDHIGLASCNLSEFPSFLRKQEKLKFLDLSSNNIEGQIPSWIWNMTSLYYMNISQNFLTSFEEGPVFDQWVHLEILDLQSNRLQGSLSISNPLHQSVSSTWRDGCNLGMINLSQNQLRGRLPRSLANCSSLEFLDIGSNQLTDVFPSWLGILPQLKVLILQSNGFFGELGKIETGEFSMLQIIDISHNKFTGELPTMYFEFWDAMKNADSSNDVTYMGKTENGFGFGFGFAASGNWFAYFAYKNFYSLSLDNKGLELEYLKIPNSLAAIDFSQNKFQGGIPNIIGNLTGIHLLNLSNNMLKGEIPPSMANMKELECLDLSGNKLFGEIPSQFTKLTYLSSFNVSYNNLSGPIPHGNQFETFESSTYEGNLGLCGAPLKNKCEKLPPNPSDLSTDESSFNVSWMIVALGYTSGLIVGVIAGHEVAKRNKWLLKTFKRLQ